MGSTAILGLSLFRSVTATGATALTLNDTGKVVFLDNIGGLTVTLPLISTIVKGWNVKFLVKSNPFGGSYIISKGSSDSANLYGGFLTNATAGAAATGLFAGSSINFVAGKSYRGDIVNVSSDGVRYFFNGQVQAADGATVS